MALIYKTPGVYVEEVSNLAPSVAGVATAIPAFVGCTTDGESNSPKSISSLLEYVKYFGEGPELTVGDDGKIVNAGFVMYDSLRLFFANGGKTCYIVSVGKTESVPGAAAYTDAIDKLEAVDEVTLVACPDAALLLSATNLITVQQAMLAHCAKMKDRIAIIDVVDTGDFRDNIGLTGLSYGAAYYPKLKSAYQADFKYAQVVYYMVQKGYMAETDAAYGYAEDYDTAESMPETDDAEKKAKKAAMDEALFNIKKVQATNPYYAQALEELQEMACVITPSAAVAGAIVSSDNTVGVWQAPANVSLACIKDVTVNVTNEMQEDLNAPDNGKAINAIRRFSGKGILIWGARTLDALSNEWKYIPVRRLFNYIEESVQKSTSWAMFQPNVTNTWVKLKSQISNFLTTLWRAGAMAGATPEEAFFVNVGKDITMTQDDINNGNLIIQVGIAAVRPAEFIILEFSHKVQQ